MVMNAPQSEPRLRKRINKALPGTSGLLMAGVSQVERERIIIFMLHTELYKPRIFTWHIHGTYLYYLSLTDIEIYIPVNEQRSEGYVGRGNTFPFGDNVIEIPAAEVRNINFDCILFQTKKNYLTDQYEVLSNEQRTLPSIYLEHDPPWESPADAVHVVNDPDVALVHVTHYNRLMWHNRVPVVEVIEHGIPFCEHGYTGELERGLVVVNNLHSRGRKLGADLYDELKEKIPLDLIGMNTDRFGGLGEVLFPDLPQFVSRYRFLFNPIRYTSLGLGVLECMALGVPVVALATTEYPTVFTNGHSGFVSTNVRDLCTAMNLLLAERELAKKIGMEGRKTVRERFGMARFNEQWRSLISFMMLRAKTNLYEMKHQHFTYPAR